MDQYEATIGGSVWPHIDTALNLPPDTDPNVAIKDLISQGKLSEVTAVKDAAAQLQK